MKRRSWPTVASVALCALWLSACGPGGDNAPDAPVVDLLVHSVTIVSAERDEPLRDAWVAVSDERIVELGTGEPHEYRAAQVIDGSGRFLTPGLIDSHVHLASVPGIPPEDAGSAEFRELVAAYETQLPRSHLFFGFTTVIDLNITDPDFLTRFLGAPHRPDVHHCGGALALANGYPMVFAPEDVRFDLYPNFLWDARQSDQIPQRFEAANHSPAAAVERVAGSGGICVKVHREDGFGAAKIWPTPTPELIREVIDASHERGLVATIHANSLEAHLFADAVDADVVVHGLWNWDGVRQVGDELPQPIAEALQRHIDDDRAIMPTTQVLVGLRDLYDAAYLDDPRLLNAIPGALLDWYRTPQARWYADSLRTQGGRADDAAMVDFYDAVIDQAQRVVTHLATSDARFLFGSDTPSGPTYANPPGLNGAQEIELLATAGMTPRQIFRAATIENARAFHLDDVGTVEVGKRANLLLLRQDPLSSSEAWSSIETVILGGTPIERSGLSARAMPSATD